MVKKFRRAAMEVSKSTEVKVGLMIGAGLALFMVTTILLGGSKRFLSATTEYKVQMESVAGVAVGSVVQLAGIPVGNVKHISFVSGSTGLEIVLQIDSNYQNRITEGTVAGVRTQGALGDKFIYITPGPADKTVLAEGTVIPTEKGGDLFSTIAESGDDFMKVFEVINQVNKLVANLNADGKSAQLMPNLVESSAELAKVLKNLNLILEETKGKDGKSNLAQSMASLQSVLGKIDKGQGTLGALINDSEIHDRIKSALGGSAQKDFMKNQARETIRKAN
jgi:phospholipid/cholesterol/gamma-HCH transport system substrate-binding protein